MIYASEIHRILAQKYPVLMVDRIISVDYGKSCVGIKNVSMNEPWTVGHFPGSPILPGTYIIEAMAQTGGFIFHDGEKDIKGYIASIDKVKFLKPVIPGDCIVINCTSKGRYAKFAKVAVECTVDEYTVAKGEITYAFETNIEN